MKNQNGLKILLLLSILTMLTACAKPTTADNNDFSSVSNTATAYAECSQGTSYGNLMKINIRSVVRENKVQSDLMRLYFSTLNSRFSTDSSYIQIFRWKASSTTQKYLDTNPLSFRTEALSSGEILTNYNTTLKWSDLNYARLNQNVTTVAELIPKIRLTVNTKDVDSSYQVLKVVYYDSNNNAVDQADLLMPLFSAHPTNYALEPSGGARPTILQNLHPFRNLASQGMTATQILTYSNNNYCF